MQTSQISYAKINLFIDVLAKLDSGYHQIRTIFSEIDLCDKLNFVLTKKGSIKILTNKDFVSVENNLIYKVAIFIKQKYNVQCGAEIELEKNIPISAGLGGGSSNAAHTILALSQLWDLNLSKTEMHQIAEIFGSDINFFLEGGTALGENRGEIISLQNDLEIENIFLINPGFEISSKEAYQLVNISTENQNWSKILTKKDMRFCFNKLEEEISRKYPVIKNIIDDLKDNGASNAILSGSGATIIGFCPDFQTAQKFETYYSKKGFWNIITKTKRRIQNGNYRC